MSSSPIPKVRDDDPEDVSWALSTAATSFARGDRAEALKWLRRAAEAASEAERDARALELAKAAAELAPPSAVPPPPPTAKSLPKSTAARATSTPSTPKRAHGGRASKPDDAAKRLAVRPKGRPHPGPTEAPKTDERSTHPGTPEADAWPTESMSKDELDAMPQVYGQERTRIGRAAYSSATDVCEQPLRVCQAVHVVLWRDGTGTLRVAPRGTPVSAVTIEALLVAPGPDVDLVAWLTPT